MTERFSVSIELVSPSATRQLAEAISPHLMAGDTILLSGEIGAGKSHFARSAILTLLGPGHENDEVPSPTYTLVQTYDAGPFEVWHADLYRVGDESEILELGLHQAMEDCVVLIEWPDMMGSHRPDDALSIALSASSQPQHRLAEISGPERFEPMVRQALAKVAQTT